MKQAIVMIAIVMFGLAAVGDAFAGRAANRHVRQAERIGQGIRSGELTRPETAALKKEQWRIVKFKRHAWADGVFTPRERACVERRQNRASARIYRFKHNDFSRFKHNGLSR